MNMQYGLEQLTQPRSMHVETAMLKKTLIHRGDYTLTCTSTSNGIYTLITHFDTALTWQQIHG